MKSRAPQHGEIAYLRVRVVQGPTQGDKPGARPIWLCHGLAADGSQDLFAGVVGTPSMPLLVYEDQLVLPPVAEFEIRKREGAC